MVLVLPITTATSALRVAMWGKNRLYGKLTANGVQVSVYMLSANADNPSASTATPVAIASGEAYSSGR